MAGEKRCESHAIAAWFRPTQESASYFSAQQTTQAKTDVCSAYTVVHQAVVVNTHLANPTPDNPAGQLAVAANARLALLGGGAYLRDRVAAEPAAPADLTKVVAAMAITIEQLGTNYLAGAPKTVQDPLRHDLDAEITQLNGLCGQQLSSDRIGAFPALRMLIDSRIAYTLGKSC